MLFQVNEMNLKDIPIVCEFQDFLPNDLSRLSPDRKVKFTINLILVMILVP